MKKYIIFFVILIFYFIINRKNNLESFIEENNWNNIIVKIHSQNINYDWINPFKKNNSYESIGTGFFFDNKGHILTVAHNVENSIIQFVSIPSKGETKFKTKLICVFPEFDLAVLKILNYKNKNYLSFGDISNITYGTSVIALGYPLGQNKLKLTAGVVSGLQYGSIQTDTSINPGNSGGPLIDKSTNKVIGINFSRSASSKAENIGYAIPINIFKLYQDSILKNKYEKVKILYFPALGVQFTNCNHSLLRFKNIKNKNVGYYINTVLKNSPFDKNNVLPGDILYSIDNTPIDFFGEITMPWFVGKIHIYHYIKFKYKAGDEINFKIYRNNKLLEKKITITSSVFYKIRYMYPLFEKQKYEVIGGIIFMNLTLNHFNHLNNLDMLKYKLIVNRIKNKVVITNILNGSKIYNDKILSPGNIVKKINKIHVNSIEDLTKAMNKPIDNKYLIIETESNIIFTIEINIIKKQDKFLSKKYKYKTNYTF